MKKSFYFIALFSFILALTISSIIFVSFNENYFDTMYKKLSVAKTVKVDEDTLMEVNHMLLDYIKGEENSLDYSVNIEGHDTEFFNQKEKDHMVDVRDLYSTAITIRNASFLVSIVGLVVLIVSKDVKDLVLIKNTAAKVLLSYGLILGTLSIVAVLDFDFFWTSMHELVFTNDLWLLNPQTDRLIMMVPLEFFMGLVYRILMLVGLIFTMLFASFKVLEKKVKL